MQNIFRCKYKMTLPIHTTTEVPLDRTEVRLADLDEEENICYIDSAHMLYVIMAAEAKPHSHALKRKHHFTHLQWVDENRIILQTQANYIFVYEVPEITFLLALKP